MTAMSLAVMDTLLQYKPLDLQIITRNCPAAGFRIYRLSSDPCQLTATM